MHVDLGWLRRPLAKEIAAATATATAAGLLGHVGPSLWEAVQSGLTAAVVSVWSFAAAYTILIFVIIVRRRFQHHRVQFEAVLETAQAYQTEVGGGEPSTPDAIKKYIALQIELERVKVWFFHNPRGCPILDLARLIRDIEAGDLASARRRWPRNWPGRWSKSGHIETG